MSSADDPSPASPPMPRRLRLSTVALGMALGSVVTLVALLTLAAVFLRDPLPPVTEEEINAVEKLWKQNGPPNYNLDVLIGGRQPGKVHIEVRNRTVTAMTRDGVTPKRRQTWDAWTVPYQLDTIRRELSSSNDPQRGFGAPPGSQVVMRAKFHPTLGYPIKYRRNVMGTPLEVEWEVVRFQAVEN